VPSSESSSRGSFELPPPNSFSQSLPKSRSKLLLECSWLPRWIAVDVVRARLKPEAELRRHPNTRRAIVEVTVSIQGGNPLFIQFTERLFKQLIDMFQQ
jgi:hypothetical protein